VYPFPTFLMESSVNYFIYFIYIPSNIYLTSQQYLNHMIITYNTRGSHGIINA